MKVENLKSQTCFAGSLFTALIYDTMSGLPSSEQSSLKKDLSTILERMANEGISFCTIRLPLLGKAMIQSFQTGLFVCPPGFARQRGTTLPRLFSGLLQRIYTNEGTLRDDADVASISDLYQLSHLMYKLDLGYSPELCEAVYDSFREIERGISTLDFSNDHDSSFIELASCLVDDIFSEFNPKDINPRHGSGSVATRELGNDKWKFSRKYDSIHQCYPYFDYFVVNRKHLVDKLDWYRSLVPEQSGVAKVSLVPKDSRGPRLISLEPLEYQYIQQGLWRSIHSLLKVHPFTRGHVNFEDQTINGSLAIAGSIDGSWATLDMKDASDRVSLLLVRSLFKGVPYILRHLESARSTATKFPDGTVLPLGKFAPMGSALCFPIESIVHYVLCVTSVMMHSNLTYRQAKKFVYVYGDDIIVATKYARGIMDDLERFGLRFNRDKCFLSGPFRESCGVDAFKGVTITPTRWRKPWPKDRHDVASIQAHSDFASHLYLRGYCRAAELVWRKLEALIGSLPTVPSSWKVGYLTRITRIETHVHTPHPVRRNLDHQSIDHKAKTVKRKTAETEMDGWSRTHKYLSSGDGTSKEYSDRSSLKDQWKKLI